MNKKLLSFLVVFVLVFVSFQSFGQGCSQCKMIATQGATITEVDEASFGTNINYGILYLMLIPYFLLMFLFRNKIISFTKSLFAGLARK